MSKIRLHKYLKDLVQKTGLEFTAPEIQRNIETYGAQIDGEMIFKRLEWVIPSQEVSIDHWPEREKGNFKEVKILYRDNTYMVAFKPINVVMQPGAGHQKNNLQVYFQDLYNQNWLPVNRLDKDTQGIVMMANGDQNQQFFQDQFRARTVRKKYLAVVDNLVDKLLIVENYQTRSQLQPTRQKVIFDDLADLKARLAKSKFTPVLYSKETNKTLIEVEIFTGRMHQIRLQCEALGFPISQDKVYHGSALDHNLQEKIITSSTFKDPKQVSLAEFDKLQKQIFQYPQHNLLSNYLEFTDKGGQRVSFEMADLGSLLA
jgi:23S rRNA-/tRNA-specific pseudouridylate synthase